MREGKGLDSTRAYDFYTFGHYSDDTTPRTMLSGTMNELATKYGWECFSVTSETTGFFRRRTSYLLHCRRLKPQQ